MLQERKMIVRLLSKATKRGLKRQGWLLWLSQQLNHKERKMGSNKILVSHRITQEVARNVTSEHMPM